MKLYIIRHGQPDYDRDCLTELGKKQASTIAGIPWTQNVNRILCSPLGRAVETAEPLEKYLNISSEIQPWLREMEDLTVHSSRRDDLAIWNIAPRELYRLEQCWQTEQENFPCELFEERWNEIAAGINSILHEYGLTKTQAGWHIEEDRELPENIPIFCHLGVGMTLLSYLLDVSPFRIWRTCFLPQASVTCLLLEKSEESYAAFRMLQMGDVSHLMKNGIEISSGGLQYNTV